MTIDFLKVADFLQEELQEFYRVLWPVTARSGFAVSKRSSVGGRLFETIRMPGACRR